MKKIALAFAGFLFATFAQAQDVLVVISCGTLPQAYAVGSSQLMTVDTTGKLCLGGNSGNAITSLTGDVTAAGPGAAAATLATNQPGAHTWAAAQTYSGTEINSTNGGASIPSKTFTGTVFTGGSGTTTFPQIFVQPTGTTAATTWNTGGTIVGANAVSGFAGNFLDFHVAGAASVFSVGSTGTLNASGNITSASSLFTAGGGLFGWTGRGSLSSPTSGSVQLGQGDADTNASIVAQTSRSQGALAGGTADQAGKNWTFIASPGKGTGAGGSLIFQTAPAGSTGTAVNAPVTGLALNSAGLLTNPTIITDAGLTDTTVCQDTTLHGFHAGSGTLGICLGTSGRQFKTDFTPMIAGIDDLMKISFMNYRYRKGYGDNGATMQYGTTAQDVEVVLPDIARHDAAGETINYDSGALLFIGLRAIQQLKADNDNLRAELTEMKAEIRRR